MSHVLETSGRKGVEGTTIDLIGSFQKHPEC